MGVEIGEDLQSLSGSTMLEQSNHLNSNILARTNRSACGTQIL
jgi:hypothetical protein